MNILVLTDFSVNAKNALYFALDLALESNANVKILNCVSAPPSKSNVVVSIMDILKEDSEKGLNELQNDIKNHKEYSTLKLEMLSSVGELSSTVEEISSQWNIDFIVMGTKGMTALEEIFIGSNTTKMISEVELPLLAIPMDCKYSSIKEITFAADLVELKSKEILAPLKLIASSFVDTIQLFHVYGNKENQLESEKRKELEEIKSYLSPLIIKEVFADHSKSSQELADFSSINKNDLLAMVSRKHGFFKRLFSTSNTETVALKTAIPLLVLPERN
tara:strand:- start:1405 stop:2232 length:828 start_codon:yes stop_codon:yes gene_type:complete